MDKLKGLTDGYSDFHVHPDYSKDASGSVDEYCQKALELGLKRICFTTHYDTDPQRKKIDYFMRVDGKLKLLSFEVVKRYIDDVKVAKSKYLSSGLEVYVGLEVDYALHIEENLRSELAKLDLDFVLGAIHCLDHIAITASSEAHQYFERKTLKEYIKEYFKVFTQASSSGLFDCMAHLDGYKKYGLKFYGNEILSAHREFIEPALDALVKNNVGIEINTSAKRKGQDEFYPSKEILYMVKEKGIEVVAIGSDAHRVEDLGKDIEEAAKLVGDIYYQKNKIKK
ncbi:MAG: hypothetical protein AMJ90_00130 [candidate division Zixibacteria bacterium SM23_73_2]|nr:MAG: hypothetical protein AMJ90_00130 [candidate division Zixibacteria bacterium SM23_73_2]